MSAPSRNRNVCASAPPATTNTCSAPGAGSPSPTVATRVPSTSDGSSSDRWASVPASASTAAAITVGRKGPGTTARPQLLDDDGELGEAVALSAVLLGDVQAEPPERGELGPELGKIGSFGMPIRLERRTAGGFEQATLLGERARHRGQGPVVLRQRQRHAADLSRIRVPSPVDGRVRG